MTISCLFGRHRARPGAVRNQGLEFSRCERCARDMVRSRSAWRLVPRGFRVVWRQAGATGVGLPAPAARGTRAREETLATRAAALLSVAGAGLRALAWCVSDRLACWSRHAPPARPPALLRLPTP